MISIQKLLSITLLLAANTAVSMDDPMGYFRAEKEYNKSRAQLVQIERERLEQDKLLTRLLLKQYKNKLAGETLRLYKVQLPQESKQEEWSIQQDPENHPFSTLLGLPDEVILHILSFLPTSDYVQISQVSRKLYWISFDKKGTISHLKITMKALDPDGTKAQYIANDFNNLWEKNTDGCTLDSDIEEIRVFIGKHKDHIKTLCKEIDSHYNLFIRQPSTSFLDLKAIYKISIGKISWPSSLEKYVFPSFSQEEIEIIKKLGRLFERYYLDNPNAKIEPHVLQIAEYAKPIIPNLSKDKLEVLKGGKLALEQKFGVKYHIARPLITPFYTLSATQIVQTLLQESQAGSLNLDDLTMQLGDEDEFSHLPPLVDDEEGSQ